MEFNDIMRKFAKEVTDGYLLKITDNEIWITEKVNNLLFQKHP